MTKHLRINDRESIKVLNLQEPAKLKLINSSIVQFLQIKKKEISKKVRLA